MVVSRLLTGLDRTVAGPAPVLLITAPAGSGKTALITAWAEHRSRTRPGVRTLRLPGERAPEFLRHRNIHRLCDESYCGETILIIDDAHHLVTDGAIRTVEEFLSTAPPGVITVLTARRPPALSWHTLACTARLTRWTAAELALDRAGTAEAAAAAGCPFTAPEATLVHELTRGWPMLVRLAATYLGAHREYRGAAVTMLEHAPRPLAEFLDTEVLPALDEDERELLAGTRLLPEFTADLADALTEGRASSALERLENAGFPLRRHLRDGVAHYSFPPLLRGHFTHTARPVADAVWIDPANTPQPPATLPAEHPPQHAARLPTPEQALRNWCRTHPSETVLPYLLAAPGRPHLIEFLSEHAVRLVLDAHGPALFGPLEDARCPLLDDPALSLLHTADALVRGARLRHLANPPRRASRLLDPPRLTALESAVAADLAIHADTATLHAFALPARPERTGHAAIDYYWELALATAHTLRGDTVLGERGLRRACALAETMSAPRLRLRAQVRLALTALLAGRPSAARERAAQAMELAARSGLTATADHARAVTIRALCAPRRAESSQRAEAGAEAPLVAETGESVLFRSVRRVVAESNR